jgi:hypothetical protein
LEVPDIMNERLNQSKEQPPLDPRANLFYFLQKMSGLVKASGCESVANAAISGEQIESYQRQTGMDS